MSHQKIIPKLVIILFAIDFFLCFSYGINFFIGKPSEQLTRLLDLNGEMNIPTWYSSVQWFCVSFLFGIFAIRNFDSSMRSKFLFLLPLVFLVFSIDEVACIHEWMGNKTDVFLPNGNRNGTFFHATGLWVFVIGVPIFLGCLRLLTSMRRYFARCPKIFRKMMVGTFIFFGGAIGVEILSNIPGRDSFGFVVENIFEEGMELAGVTVLFWAACDLLSEHGFRWHLDQAIEEETSINLLETGAKLDGSKMG